MMIVPVVKSEIFGDNLSDPRICKVAPTHASIQGTVQRSSEKAGNFEPLLQ